MLFSELYNLTLDDLANEHHKLEMELERLANVDMNTSEKIEQIKLTLNKIVVNELMIGKWQRLQPDNNEDKEEDNGQI